MVIQQSHQDSVLKVVGSRDAISMQLIDVSHLNAWSNYTFISYKGKKVLSSKILRYYENIIDKPSFIRTHKSFCVNLNYIKKVDFCTRIITLLSCDEIPLAISRKKVIKAILLKVKYSKDLRSLYSNHEAKSDSLCLS